MGDVIWLARKGRPCGTGRMVDQAAAMAVRLSRKGKVSIEDLSNELGISRRSVYRWASAFSLVMDIRIEGGDVVVESDIFCR